jgi:rhamnogalacturonyl hydrolase YesR
MSMLSVTLLLSACAVSTKSPAPKAAKAPVVDAKETATAMRRVFDWQIANLWSTAQPVDHRWGMRGWVQGAFLTGVMEAYRATNDPAYLNYARKVANDNSWKLGPRPYQGNDHADDHIIGQTYLELHRLSPADSPIEETRQGIDRVIEKQHTGRKLWWWCDAIYMAPPTFAKLAQITGDKRYLEEMDRLFWDATEYLYDPAEKLYYRDDRFFALRDGKKVFWSRGNGWVIAGLARLLDEIPADHPTRPRYVALYKDMAERIASLQPADGLWRTNVMHPEEAPHGEVSGSAFFCYALAWGINNGILPADQYLPVVLRTWNAMLPAIAEDGRLGWVQPIGSSPDPYSEKTWQEYGAGAFLAAGSQMLKLR